MSEFLRSYGPIIIMLIQVVFAWVLWSLSRKFCTVEKCDEHRQSVAISTGASRLKVAEHIDELRNRIEKLPDRTEIQDLSREMNEMNKTLGKLEGRLSGIGRAVDLMNQHLISKGEKA